MMLDDEVSSFGVYGYKDGRVYIRDARKGTKKYLSDKANADLDDPGFQCFGGALQPTLSFSHQLTYLLFSCHFFLIFLSLSIGKNLKLKYVPRINIELTEKCNHRV